MKFYAMITEKNRLVRNGELNPIQFNATIGGKGTTFREIKPT